MNDTINKCNMSLHCMTTQIFQFDLYKFYRSNKLKSLNCLMN